MTDAPRFNAIEELPTGWVTLRDDEGQVVEEFQRRNVSEHPTAAMMLRDMGYTLKQGWFFGKDHTMHAEYERTRPSDDRIRQAVVRLRARIDSGKRLSNTQLAGMHTAAAALMWALAEGDAPYPDLMDGE